jgi:hypothetical protein
VASFIWSNAVTGYQTYTVPAGTTYLRVRLWGAGGGASLGYAGVACNGVRAPGGAGAYVAGFLRVTPGETLRAIAGRGGGQLDNWNGSTLMAPFMPDFLGSGGRANKGSPS